MFNKRMFNHHLFNRLPKAKPQSTSSVVMGILLASTLTFTACQSPHPIHKTAANAAASSPASSPAKTTTDAGMEDKQTQITPKQLATYEWQLLGATDGDNRPIGELTLAKDSTVLTFSPFSTLDDSQTVGFSVGCNGIGADYQLEDNVLTVSNIVSTLMLCQQLDRAEKKLSQLMSGSSQLSLKTGATPILTQITDDNATLVWRGSMTKQARYGSEGETLFWAIDHASKPCHDGSTKTCLQIQPVYYDAQGIKSSTGQWQLFDGVIEGYTHDPSVDSIIRLKRYVVEPKDIKGKSYAYVYDMTVEQATVKQAGSK